jgi:hypothetical protein
MGNDKVQNVIDVKTIQGMNSMYMGQASGISQGVRSVLIGPEAGSYRANNCDPQITVNKLPNKDGSISIVLKDKYGNLTNIDLAREQLVELIEDATFAAARQTLTGS